MTDTPQLDGNAMDVIGPTGGGILPDLPRRLCRGCGTLLDESLQQQRAKVHPGCTPRELNFHQAVTAPGTDHPMRTTLINLIRYVDRNKPRSRQVNIGPSEIGGSCDRRLAMRIAGIRTINRTSDPLPSIVGTAMHDWLERCMTFDNNRYIAAGREPRWLVEEKVSADPLVRGISDVYDRYTFTVIDWKSMGENSRKRLEKEGPSDSYWTQIQTYGVGYTNAGFRVDNVALMFLPRAGYLKDARYYERPFEPAVARSAINRVYRIGNQLIELRNRHNGSLDRVWPLITADTGALCGWCPFFNPALALASDQGCPGK